MPFAPPNLLAFSRLLADDLHLGALLALAVSGGLVVLWRRRARREADPAIDLASQ